ncbi:MAG: cysteine--tRNA ligase [Candidatus Saccharimonadales bacterium]|jgi:cysteinyl-tRNA synthetase
MKLYNTLSRQVEDFAPLNPPVVTVYTCGPTVYDYPHVGNWFTFIRYDLLIRTLRLAGYRPKWVLNITDVGHLVSDADEGEDKLEKSARREGKSAWEVAKFYTDYFLKGLERLSIAWPDHLPRATEHINEQIELIKQLQEKGYTYQIDDGLYYDTSKFPKYADFARLDLDEQQSSERIESNPQKQHHSDFALWKFSPRGSKRDMEWDSPWGKGFPGWHIECSAMIMKYLGETIDIHSGGIDHVPIHHSNEIAQSEAVTGKPLARYWMHTNHILVDRQKMAKSAGNFITLEDIEQKGYSLDALRLLVLQSHYRTQSKFNWDELAAAQNRLLSYRSMADQQWQTTDSQTAITAGALDSHKQAIQEALENDLNTPLALVALSSLATAIETSGVSHTSRKAFIALIQWLNDILGLRLRSEDLASQQKGMIAQREQARDSGNWALADELRDKLKEQGIEINDTSRGPIWSRT